MDNNTQLGFIPSQDLNWRGVLKGITKALDPFQPLYEAFTNSLESIELRKKQGECFDSYIQVDFFFNTNTEKTNDGLSKLVITDNGIGFDKTNFISAECPFKSTNSRSLSPI